MKVLFVYKARSSKYKLFLSNTLDVFRDSENEIVTLIYYIIISLP